MRCSRHCSACCSRSPFFTAHLRAARRLESGSGEEDALAAAVGVGDSVLVHLWQAAHRASPPFRALRVHPLQNVARWRERVLRLPFVVDWHGRPFVGAQELDDTDEQ